MISLRTFRNDDLPALVNLWTEHFAAVGIDVRLAPATFEQAILNRTFFDASHLLVAEQARQAIGLATWLLNPNATEQAIVPAICVRPSATADETGLTLLRGCEAAAKQAGCSMLIGGNEASQATGYLGLAPLGPGMGIIDADRMTANWFMQSGYAVRHRLSRYAVSLVQFRPPVDRMQMQLRRSATVECESRVCEPTRLAAALAHVDIERFSAKTRGGDALGWADLYLSDPEAHVFPAAHGILAAWKSNVTDDQNATIRFLLASAMQQLASRGLTRIEAVASDAHPDQAVTLRSLRFDLDGEGTLFAKRL